jgi:hypothetical protein
VEKNFITSDVLFKRFETPKKKKDSFIKKIKKKKLKKKIKKKKLKKKKK